MTKLGDTTLSEESQRVLAANGFATIESLSTVNASILSNLNGSNAHFVMEVIDFLNAYKTNPDSIRKKNTAVLYFSDKTISLIERNLQYCKIMCCEKMALDFKSELGDFSAAKFFSKLKKTLPREKYVFSEDSREFVIAIKGYDPTRKALIEHLIDMNNGQPVELNEASDQVGLSPLTLQIYLSKGVWPTLFLLYGHLVWCENRISYDPQTIGWVAGYVRIMGDAALKTEDIIQILCKTKQETCFNELPLATQRRCAVEALKKAGFLNYYYDEASDTIIKNCSIKKKWFFD